MTETPAKRSCEAIQSMVAQNQGQQVPIAEIAFGRAGNQNVPLQVTVLLPVNVSFDKPVRIGPDDARLTTLLYRCCVPAGCFASVAPDAGTIAGLRNAMKPGRLAFTDAGERMIVLPVSFRGLGQALDELDKVR